MKKASIKERSAEQKDSSRRHESGSFCRSLENSYLLELSFCSAERSFSSFDFNENFHLFLFSSRVDQNPNTNQQSLTNKTHIHHSKCPPKSLLLKLTMILSASLNKPSSSLPTLKKRLVPNVSRFLRGSHQRRLKFAHQKLSNSYSIHRLPVLPQALSPKLCPCRFSPKNFKKWLHSGSGSQF